jgi:hypothetical protein
MSAALARRLVCQHRPVLHLRRLASCTPAPRSRCVAACVLRSWCLAPVRHADHAGRGLHLHRVRSAWHRAAARQPMAAATSGDSAPVYVTTPIYYVNDRPHIGCVC